jgi:uncharacterized membrane protein YraQ (UPF0718 family)
LPPKRIGGVELAAAPVPEPRLDRAWARVGRVSGYVVAGGLLLATILYLLDATNALGAGPSYEATDAGPVQDEANFFVAYFAHQHHILWDIIGRDTIFPVAFVALAVVAVAIRRLVGLDEPGAQLLTVFFVIGAVVAALSDLIYLGAAEYWRVTGWSAQPPERMLAIGRSSEAIEGLTTWIEAAGFVILAAGLVCLGRLCRSRIELPSKLGLVADVEALLLVGIAIAGAMHAETPYDVLSLVTGALIGPAVGLWLGLHLGRVTPERRRTSAPEWAR